MSRAARSARAACAVCAAATCCASALAACGGDALRPQLRQALAELGAAADKGDTGAACRSVLLFGAQQPRAELIGYLHALARPGGAANLAAVTGACRTAFTARPAPLRAALGQLAGARLRAAAGDGPLARASVRERSGRIRTVRFARVPGGWRLLLDSSRP